MEFLNGERERKPFECKIRVSIANDYEVRVYEGNTAYRHEVNALIMAIEGCCNITTFQKIDSNEEIYWRLW